MRLAVLTFQGPPEDCPSAEEIVDRLRAEFEAVRVDAGEGRAYAEKQLATLRRVNAPAPIVELTERGLARAQWVEVRDGGRGFGFLLASESNIRVEDDGSIGDLVERCAAAIGWHVEDSC